MSKPSSVNDAGSTALSNDTAGSAAHQWFTMLDQRPLSVGAERWRTQVVGIHEDGSDVWIQLQPLREQLRDLTIRVRPGMSLDDVVTAIEKLIRDAAWAGRQSV
ncbi:MAG TPA: hypothetical protein VGD94_00865 [Vicinamibacterales bacterium]